MESATTAGVHPGRNADAISVFHLAVPGEGWRGAVLAVADGQSWPVRGDVASAVAVAGIEQGLTEQFRQLDVRSPGWHDRVAEAFTAAFRHAHHRIRALRDSGLEPLEGIGLTVALLLGDWLCVAHAGDGRVYRRSRGELEQLTADQGGASARLIRGYADRRLGLASYQPPAIRFFPLKPGDLVMVCSKGLSRQLDGTVLAQLLGPPAPLTHLARHLITVAAARRGRDDASLCLTRVRRLPARLPASGRIDFEQASEAATLPRYPSRAGGRWDLRQLAAGLGTVALVGGLLLGWRVWRPLAHPDVVASVDSPRRPAEGVGALGSPPVATPAPSPPAPVAKLDSVIPRPAVTAPLDAPVPRRQPVPAPDRRRRDDSAKRRPTVTAPADPPVPKRQPAPTPDPRRRDDSLLTVKRAAAERARQDSVALEARLTEERLQRLRDQARPAPPAAEKVDAQAQATQERRAAEQRRADQEAASLAAAEKAAAADKAEAARAEAGAKAVNSWLVDLVNAVNADNEAAEVFTTGPASFVAFMDKYHPKLTDARVVQRTVDGEAARATVVWVARWKSTFGTATSQRMMAVVTMVPSADVWQVTGWRITEGAR